jgi:hypothetical protein
MTGALCPYCRHAMASHYSGVDLQADGSTTGEYHCHWVDGVPSGRCDCARPIKGWNIYGERDR